MQSQRKSRAPTSEAKAVATKTAEAAHARKMEVSFLMTATLVIIVTVGLVAGYHLQ